MLDVFFTVDVEIWCGGKENAEARFPKSFQQYVYGHTPNGEYGLAYMLQQLKDYGLTGVFFVEPLFALRFGIEPLAEIISLVKENHQELQLHLHTEWVDELTKPKIGNVADQGQFLRHFSLEDQTKLIAAGLHLIECANGGKVNAFRAGNFGANRDTLGALAANNIEFDSSYNASVLGLDSGIMPGQVLHEPVQCDGVYEYPMTVFDDGTRSLRHAQLTACSYQEMESLLWQALHAGRKTFVLLSHNFELLNLAKDRPDHTVLKRFHQLCRFLDKNRDCFRVRGFQGLEPISVMRQPTSLTSPAWKTGIRMMEQFMRRRYG